MEKIRKLLLNKKIAFIISIVLFFLVSIGSSKRASNTGDLDVVGWLIQALYTYFVMDINIKERKIKNGNLLRYTGIGLTFIALWPFLLFAKGENEIKKAKIQR